MAAGLTNTTFVQGDAQVHPFEPEGFDVAISRFGAMFFGDPVAAFTNLARALRPGGRLTLLTWQPAERERAVAALRATLEAHEGPDGVGLASATWIVTARRR